jgi:hypothetical protein
MAGAGTISGCRPVSKAEPASPTADETMKPAIERSIMNHRAGFTRPSDSETCKVESQGSLRFTGA